MEIRSTLDFQVGVRGWCYLLEAHGLAKGDFDDAAKLISDCRKDGLLPFNICAADASRSFDGGEDLDQQDPEAEAADFVHYVQNRWEHYTPYSFWDDQPYYLELLVEKIDLKSLFAPICRKYHIMHGNAKGWSDINQRVGMMRRFQQAERRGQKPVLLYCGDHDPSGLAISNTLILNFLDVSIGFEQTYGPWDPKTLIIDRFGLNFEFIEAQGLTWIDGLRTGGTDGKDLADPRHPDHDKPYVQEYLAAFGARKCEANALVVAADAGRQLLLDTIHKYVPPDALEGYAERLKEPREALRVEILKQLG